VSSVTAEVPRPNELLDEATERWRGRKDSLR
jgi:hypothetical protein